MLTQSRPRLLVDWADESSRVRRREAGMAAAVLHFALVMLVLLSPRMFSRTTLADQEPRRVTMLYLPSDLAEIPEPATPPDLTPEERKRAVVRAPLTLDPRDLRLALPPAPPSPPGVTTPPGADADTPPGGASEASSPGALPNQDEPERLPGKDTKQIVRLEDLRPRQDSEPSGLELPMTTPGRAIEESLRRGATRASPSTAPGDLGAPLPPNLNTPFPLILSDTRGVDFGPYLIRLLREIRRNWYAVMPQSVRWGEQGRVVIVFTILKDGLVPSDQPRIVSSSGRSHLDRPALGAIRASQPFPPLPSEFTGEHIVLQFTFLYNLPLDYTGS